MTNNYSNPVITIAMPVYNCESFILDSIKSIINQTFSNWELIIINDNSSDSTSKILNNIEDPRIRIYNNNERNGLAYCLNFCISLSNSEFFARMDGDDIMFNKRLELQYNYLIENTDVDIVGSNALIIDQNKNIIGKRITSISTNISQILHNGGLFIHPTVFGRTDWFKKNPYNISFLRCQDLELWVRTVDNSKFNIINDCLIFYRDVKDIKLNKYISAGNYYRKILNLNKNKISNLIFYKLHIYTYLKVLYFFIYIHIPFKKYYKEKNINFYVNELKKATL